MDPPTNNEVVPLEALIVFAAITMGLCCAIPTLREQEAAKRPFQPSFGRSPQPPHPDLHGSALHAMFGIATRGEGGNDAAAFIHC